MLTSETMKVVTSGMSERHSKRKDKNRHKDRKYPTSHVQAALNKCKGLSFPSFKRSYHVETKQVWQGTPNNIFSFLLSKMTFTR